MSPLALRAMTIRAARNTEAIPTHPNPLRDAADASSPGHRPHSSARFDDEIFGNDREMVFEDEAAGS